MKNINLKTDKITYAIGDIHGNADLLIALIDKIFEHNAGRGLKLVFLGDYIDRGIQSAKVLSFIKRLQEKSPNSVICLMGNHEATMLNAYHNPSTLDHWLRIGGEDTLRSFNARALSEVPEEIMVWLATLPTYHSDECHYYVHAGINPNKSLEFQTDIDRLWIREPFLSSTQPYDYHIIHGHTPVPMPDIRPNRTNIDTGSAYNGPLTAAIIKPSIGEPLGFLQEFP